MQHPAARGSIAASLTGTAVNTNRKWRMAALQCRCQDFPDIPGANSAMVGGSLACTGQLANSKQSNARLPAMGAFMIRIHNATLPASEFEDANLSGSRFVDVNLEEAVFSDVNLDNVLISDARAYHATFRKTSMESATFENIDMRSVALRHVDLDGASIRFASLVNVSIAECDVRGMTIDGYMVTDLLKLARPEIEEEVDER